MRQRTDIRGLHYLVRDAFALFLFLCVISCASAPKTDPVPAKSFEPKGIELKISASGQLNSVDGDPHTVLLLVYQLENLNSFKDLLKSEAGIEKLLQAEKYDPSVLSIDRLIIEPGDSRTFLLDRVENSKWVGIVAGYYSLSPKFVSRFYEIPVSLEKTGVYGFRKTEAKMGRLTVSLNLGPDSLNEMDEKK